MTVQQVDLASTDSVQATIGAPAPRTRRARNPAYLFGPAIDFLGLGGGSVLALGLLLLLAPAEGWLNEAGVWALVAALFINNPHFAYSYQIFYGDFRAKAFGAGSPLLRARYVFAGIVVPLAMIGFFAGCIATQNVVLLGVSANAMSFFVGWHYVKQGYGMAIVDSVLKQRPFGSGEKKILLLNAYACWVASWLLANAALQDIEFWGLHYYQFAVPAPIVSAGVWFAYGCGGLTLLMLARKTLIGGRPPLNGTIAYLVSLYLWLVFVGINPFFLLIIPAFHSLQYMLVVWRYRLNRERDTPEARLTAETGVLPKKSLWRLGRFATIGLVLGFLGFWGAPMLLDRIVPYDSEVFGTALFLFMFWIFVNVHHYFLDNVMWRRENPEMGKYLFGRR